MLLVELDRVVGQLGLGVHADPAGEPVAGADHAALAQNGPVELRTGADARPPHQDAALHLGIGADHDLRLCHRLGHDGALADHRPPSEDGERAHAGALADADALADVARRHHPRAGGDLGVRRQIEVLVAEQPGHRGVDLP